MFAQVLGLFYTAMALILIASNLSQSKRKKKMNKEQMTEKESMQVLVGGKQKCLLIGEEEERLPMEDQV